MKRLFWVSLIFPLWISCSSLDQETLQVDFYNLALDFQQAGYPDKAEFYYKQALELPDPPLEIYYNLTLIYLQKEDLRKADSNLGILEKMDPGSRELLRLRVYTEFYQNNTPEAQKFAEKLLELYPADPYALEILAQIAIDEEHWEEAEDLLLSLREQYINETTFSLFYKVLEELGKEEKLKEYLHDFRDQDWLTEIQSERLLELYFQFGETSYAYGLIDTLIDRYPSKKGAYLFQKARWILVEEMLWDEGISLLREAFRSGFKDQGAMEKLVSELDERIGEEVKELFTLFVGVEI